MPYFDPVTGQNTYFFHNPNSRPSSRRNNNVPSHVNINEAPLILTTSANGLRRSFLVEDPLPSSSTRRPPVNYDMPSTSYAIRNTRNDRPARRRRPFRGDIPRAPFYRLVKEIVRKASRRYGEFRVSKRCYEVLQEITETFFVNFFDESLLCTVHAGRVTLRVEDFYLNRRLKGRTFISN